MVHILVQQISHASMFCSAYKLDCTTGTRSKIFNEIVLKDNHFLTLHKNVYRMTIKVSIILNLYNFIL